MPERPIVLIVPPIMDCSTGPFLGVANLKGYLKTHTAYPVRLFDWNIECLASQSFFEVLEGYLRFLQRERADGLPAPLLALAEQVGRIRADFSNPRLREYKVAAIQVLFQKLLTERNLNAIPHWLTEKNLYKIWKTFFDNKLEQLEHDCAPRLIGISISYHTQLVPALIMACLLKGRLQGVPIVLGGNFFWHLPATYLESIVRLLYVDFVIQYEGEVALHHLALACDGREPFDRVPNLVWCRGDTAVLNACIPPLPIQDYPPPNFEDLPLRLYSTGLLPYHFSRGCYWAQCHFCDIPSYTASDATRYRAKWPVQVVTDIQHLQRNYGNHPFYLVTTAIPPALCRTLVQRIDETQAQFEWLTMVRADPGFTLELTRHMYQTGCRHVAMGLESASDRVLSLMNKGITRSIFQRALDNFTAAGIQVMVEVLIDFPGTTEEEAWDTFEFLKANREKIQNLNISEFVLTPGCTVARNPDRFGVKPAHGRLDTWHGFDCPMYETTSGMSYALGKETTKRIQKAWAELTQADPLGASHNVTGC